MNLTKKEQVEKEIASGKLHLNFKNGASLSEKTAESILKFIESIEEEENERSWK